MAKLLLFIGMTPDERIFSRQLAAIPDAEIVPWLSPLGNETLGDYARRIAAAISVDEPCFLGGVSFGGLVALEVACLLRFQCSPRPRPTGKSRIMPPVSGERTSGENRLHSVGCFLISSIRSPRELPPWLRVWRPLGRFGAQRVLQAVGATASAVPRFCRTRSTLRLKKLAHDAGRWHRWATAAVLRWRPNPAIASLRVMRIHGAADRTFPIRYLHAAADDVIVPNAGHDLPLTHPEVVTNFLRDGMQVEFGRGSGPSSQTGC